MMTKRLSQPPFPTPGPRIVVVGTAGSGKTTIAKWLADLIGSEHIELDALHWGPNWTEAPIETFRQRVEQALAGSTWVVDGNYHKVRDLTWGRATTLVWLDYNLPVVLWRLVWRTVGRLFKREELWNSNRETFKNAFLSRNSLFLFAISSQGRQRTAYPQVLKNSEYAHLQIIHLCSPKETNQWLERLVKEYN